MDMNKITPETEVSQKELACVLGITGRYIRQLVEDGQLDKVRDGRFNLCDAVQRYISIKSKADNSEEAAKMERAKSKAEVQLKASKAMMAKMQVDELNGTLHRAEDVAAMTEDLIYEIRGALIALPGRLAIDVAAAGTAAEASEVIRKEVHKIMRELSNYHYDPKKYEERVRARMDWSERDDDDE